MKYCNILNYSSELASAGPGKKAALVPLMLLIPTEKMRSFSNFDTEDDLLCLDYL